MAEKEGEGLLRLKVPGNHFWKSGRLHKRN